MNPRTAFFIQGILEAAIPVYGYFEWNWDLSFILLFYLIDWILSLVLAAFKGRKRYTFSKEPNELSTLLKRLSLSILIAITAGFLFALATVNVKTGLNWTERIIDFLVYKDMGIQQGFILIPLIVLNGVLLFRQQFVAPRLFEQLTMEKIVKPVLNQNCLLLAFGGVFLGITSIASVSETVILFVLIVAITVYRMIFIRSVLSYKSR